MKTAIEDRETGDHVQVKGSHGGEDGRRQKDGKGKKRSNSKKRGAGRQTITFGGLHRVQKSKIRKESLEKWKSLVMKDGRNQEDHYHQLEVSSLWIIQLGENLLGALLGTLCPVDTSDKTLDITESGAGISDITGGWDSIHTR